MLPIFIFDTNILNTLEDKSDKRVEFIHQTLVRMQDELHQAGSSLYVLYGDPAELFKDLRPKAVYANHDYEPYARQRDKAVHEILSRNEIPFHTFKDQVIFERDEIVKDNGSPYTIFTPYSKKWKATLKPKNYKSFSTESLYANFKRVKPIHMPTLKEIGFKPTQARFPKKEINKAVIEHYHAHRNFPAIQGTTRLSVHLRFGTVSIRKLVQTAIKKNETWLNELIWRDFYHMILWHFPKVEQTFKPAYDRIQWRNNEEEFLAWCEGKTGYPIVDAGMHELNATGFMHNRVRMITASFLTKHLLIDWRWGEAYFAQKLLDFDLAANNGGWQWAAGCGCDAAPYFRVFNPYLQTKKFDPDHVYIKKWVPEVDSPEYPGPIVDHDFARKRILEAYKIALKGE